MPQDNMQLSIPLWCPGRLEVLANASRTLGDLDKTKSPQDRQPFPVLRKRSAFWSILAWACSLQRKMARFEADPEASGG